MKKREWLGSVGAAGGLIGSWLLCGATAEVGRTFLWLPLMILCWAAAQAFWRETDRRLQWCFGVLGTLFVISCALNVRLETANHTGWDGLALCFMTGICWGASAGAGFIWLYRKLGSLKTPIDLSPKKAFWIAFGVMLLCWLPVQLAFFPGITGYDIDGQAYQVYSGNYSTHHPLLHTLFLELFMELGQWLWQDYSVGYGLYTIAQYGLLALSTAYAMRWLTMIRAPRALWIAVLVFFALSPQHMIMSATGTKDVLFAAVMLVLVVELFRFLAEPGRETKPGAWVVNLLLIAAACMLRNNTVYGLLLLILLGVLFWRKKMGVRVIALLAAGVIVGTFGAFGLKTITHAEKGSVREMLVVPFQQLARIHYLYGLDVPVGYEVREVMPFVDDYSPERADAVKRQARVDTSERLFRFVKLWVREAFHYPIEYIDAFLLNCKAYWAVDDISFATTYDMHPEEPRGSMILWHNPATNIEMQNSLPQVKAVCEELFSHNGYQRFPILWTLIHPAFYTWLMGFLFACAAYRRSRAMLVCIGVLLVYLLTLLLGPCALIRYSYYLMLCLPVLLVAMCSCKGEKCHE